MPRILVLNNYPFDSVWQEVKAGEKPDHHLYGLNYFAQSGYDVEIVPFQSSKLLQKLNQLLQKFPIPLGDLDQQWSALRQLRAADLIYAPCQTQTHLLSYLRAIGLLRTPIVTLAHHPLNHGRLAWLRQPFVKLWIRGTDAFPGLSANIAASINALSTAVPKSLALHWGPERTYYPVTVQVGCGAIAAGRTGRDFETFGRAVSHTQIPAQIVCLHNSISPAFDAFTPNVEVIACANDAPMTYPALMQLYAKARVIAIPMVAGNSLCGLTSLTDALALGKPVIMTRNTLIDLDIEAEGIGKWVEPGDMEGWKAALQFFEDNEAEALAMGQRARQLVEAGMNSETFAHQITQIFNEVLKTPSRTR
jgi:hypothetical protein